MALISNSEIQQILSENIDPRFQREAGRILSTHHIVDPWEKGNLDTYLILSAVITGPHTHQARIKYKSTGSDLQSKCDCKQWSKEQHCPHAAALLVYYDQSLSKSQNLTDQDGSQSIARSSNLGLAPPAYGTIIAGIRRLEGALPNSTYHSVQYRLTDNKVIQFPIVEKFNQKLILNVEEVKTDEDLPPRYQVIFSYIDESGEEVKELSLFEYLYIFDWKNGNSFEIPNELKDFIRNLMRGQLTRPLNALVSIIEPLSDLHFLKIKICGIDWADIPTKELYTQATIENSPRKNFLQLKLQFFNEDKVAFPVPTPFQILAFENGHLNSFRRKVDSYQFIKDLVLYFEEEEGKYKHSIRNSSSRNEISSIITMIDSQKHTSLVMPSPVEIYHFDNKHFQLLMKGMLTCFTELFLRFSAIVLEEKYISFEIPKNTLLNGVYDFYQMLRPIGVPIYYNEKEVKSWSSQIRFERNRENLDWFDLNLEISEGDLEIIMGTDPDANFSVVNDKLVLFNLEQRNLMRFMKKYTKFEGTGQHTDKGFTKFALPFQRARIFELFELKKLGVDGALNEEELELCHKLQTLTELPAYNIAESYEKIGRPYQLEGYNWLRFLYENKLGACLADDMGLGKTLQTIMFLDSIYDQLDHVLIVCPVSILINWQNEFHKFSRIKPHVYYGGDREFNKDAKVILTSYGIMKKEASMAFSEMKFDILIMDEVQHLKNIRSLGAMSARTLHAKFRICLTGTPVENDLSEFYNILDLSIPGIWGDLRFVKPNSTKRNRLLAKQTARPFILRRTKDQVLKDLPDKEENTVLLNFSDEEMQRYKNTLLKIKGKIQGVIPNRKYGEILKGILELRQLCLWQSQQALSTKVEYLMENLEQIIEENHQVLIFSQFTTYLDIIEKAVQKKHWNFSRIDGKQAFKRRQQHIDKFQNGETKIFLISLRAGGVGLNLTAASYIFLMDPWWNPAVESQAIDRAHRIGQKNKVIVYRPVIKNSIEEKVLLLQERKRELFNDLLGSENDEFFTGKLTMEDFQMLLDLPANS